MAQIILSLNTRLKSLIVLPILVIISQVKSEYCTESTSAMEFPRGLWEEYIDFIKNGTKYYQSGCSEQTPLIPNSVKFYLFDRTNKENPILLGPTIDEVNTNKKIVVLLHGWLCSIKNDRIPELRNAYLDRYDSNVIAVDWSQISIEFYSVAFCKLPLVAKTIGNFLCNLGISLDSVHVVGHSMGGQLSGLVGQEVQTQCKKKLARITALDPAGPLYVGLEENRRLDKNDATFVDVIHTNGYIYGYFPPCGSADFYPNLGIVQPGCFSNRDKNKNTDLLKYVFFGVGCSHLRSLDLMIESIKGHKFYASQDRSCISRGNGITCKDSTGIIMGEDCFLDKTSGKYYLKTNAAYPFAIA